MTELEYTKSQPQYFHITTGQGKSNFHTLSKSKPIPPSDYNNLRISHKESYSRPVIQRYKLSLPELDNWIKWVQRSDGFVKDSNKINQYLSMIYETIATESDIDIKRIPNIKSYLTTNGVIDSEDILYLETKLKNILNPKEAAPTNRPPSQTIMNYLRLMPHLSGECKNHILTGGHLYTSMLAKWGQNLEIDPETNKNNSAVWTAHWKLKNDSASPKQSTFFPSEWTEEDLRTQLLASSPYGTNGRLSLPCGITVEKKGDTFYPI